MSKEKKEVFHIIVVKGIFVGKWSRPDVMPMVSVLSGCVRTPNVDNWKQLKSLLNYLKSTIKDHLVIKTDAGLNVAKWFVDATFVVDPDFML